MGCLPAEIRKKMKTPRSKADIFSQLTRGLENVDARDLRFSGTEYPFTISLIGELGLDQGGVYRDILSTIVDELKNGNAGMIDSQGRTKTDNVDAFKPRGLFTICANGRDSTASHRDCLLPSGRVGSVFSRKILLSHYRMVGKLMGIAIRSDMPISLCLAPVVYKGILGVPLCWADVCEVDDFVSKFIEKLEAGVEGWEHLFKDSVPVWGVLDGAGRYVNIDGDHSSMRTLDPQDIPKYISTVKAYRIHEHDDAIAALREGINGIVPLSALTFFTWKDLAACIEGREISITALQKKTVYGTSGTTEESDVIVWLWEILNTYSHDMRERFLRFVWGRSHLPTTERGWQNVKMTVVTGCGQLDGLPSSHTCNFQLDLPPILLNPN